MSQCSVLPRMVVLHLLPLVVLHLLPLLQQRSERTEAPFCEPELLQPGLSRKRCRSSDTHLSLCCKLYFTSFRPTRPHLAHTPPRAATYCTHKKRCLHMMSLHASHPMRTSFTMISCDPGAGAGPAQPAGVRGRGKAQRWQPNDDQVLRWRTQRKRGLAGARCPVGQAARRGGASTNQCMGHRHSFRCA